MKRRPAVIAVIIIACLSGWVSAQDKGVKSPAGNQMTPMPSVDSFSFLQSLMALTFVLGLIFLAAYLFKKVTGIKGSGLGRSRVPIQMVGHRALGEKKFLVIVEIQGKHFFLGVCPDSIQLLSRLQLDLPAESVEKDEMQSFEAFFQKARGLLNRTKEIK